MIASGMKRLIDLCFLLVHEGKFKATVIIITTTLKDAINHFLIFCDPPNLIGSRVRRSRVTKRRKKIDFQSLVSGINDTKKNLLIIDL